VRFSAEALNRVTSWWARPRPAGACPRRLSCLMSGPLSADVQGVGAVHAIRPAGRGAHWRGTHGPGARLARHRPGGRPV